MCGITGIFELSGRHIGDWMIDRFTLSLGHRGPDGHGHHISPRGNLALGHTRLAVLDVSENGRQPYHSADGRYTMTYNGEVFNFIELREELRSKGYRFKTDTDTEVVLTSYIEWGSECLMRFNGMWAFAIWDEECGKLVLARDRFGVKPLYYLYLPGDRLAFASETKAFRALDGFRREFNAEALTAALANVYYPEASGTTIFKNIHGLMPGSLLEIAGGGKPKIRRWWNTADHLHEVSLPYPQQVEEFQELLTDACRLRLRSDVPVASTLSGGLDSSAVYVTCRGLQSRPHYNSERQGRWASPYTLSFPGTRWDELEQASNVTRGLRDKLNVIQFDRKTIVDDIVNGTVASDFIYLSPPVVNTIYRRMRDDGVYVSLDGHGADEILFGYPDMMGPFVCSQDGSGSKLLRTAKSALAHRLPGALAGYRKLRYGVFSENQSGPWLFRERPHRPSATFEKIELKDVAYHEVHSGRLPTLLRNFDQGSMMHGVEIRMPFMDWRVICYCLSLPVSSRLAEGVTKRILRDAMRSNLPEAVWGRKDKVGINAPMDSWFSDELSGMLMDTVNTSRFLQSSIWNGRAIRSFVAGRIRDRQWSFYDGERVWPFINAHLIGA